MPDTPAGRPTTMTAAFWCWVVAAVLAAGFGLFLATQSGALFYRVAGGILVAAGLALAFLSGRARNGNLRFAFASVGLSLATFVFCLMLLFVSGGQGVITFGVIMLLLIVGSFLVQRADAQTWLRSRALE